MPELYDVTSWIPQPWYNTGGTRAKKYIQSPDTGKFFYFKQSENKGEKNYRYEFWSEIIAFELGRMIGFDVLRYDIGIHKNNIGCLCESMISEKEVLNEGGKYLNAFDTTFIYDKEKPGSKYTFQLIAEALDTFGLHNFIPRLIEVIVFDALISNGDRHQENWAFISNQTFMSRSLASAEEVLRQDDSSTLSKWYKKLVKKLLNSGDKEPSTSFLQARLLMHDGLRFAPIYDSGSSLGRELREDKILRMLKDKQELESYVNKGQSEIHWVKKKMRHLELVKSLSNEYPYEISKAIEQIKTNFSPNDFENIVERIDKKVPITFKDDKIPNSRKELIVRLVSLRAQKLQELL